MTEELKDHGAAVDVTMRRPSLVGVPAIPTLAAPLRPRGARVDDAAALATLLGRALEGEVWESAHVERELLCDHNLVRIRRLKFQNPCSSGQAGGDLLPVAKRLIPSNCSPGSYRQGPAGPLQRLVRRRPPDCLPFKNLYRSGLPEVRNLRNRVAATVEPFRGRRRIGSRSGASRRAPPKTRSPTRPRRLQ